MLYCFRGSIYLFLSDKSKLIGIFYKNDKTLDPKYMIKQIHRQLLWRKKDYYANIPEIIVRKTIEDDDPPTTTCLSLCVADAFKQMEIYALVDEFQAFTG